MRSQLQAIWAEIGISGARLETRQNTVVKGLESLAENMIAEEMSRKKMITENVRSLEADVQKILGELGQAAVVDDCKLVKLLI